MPLNNKSRLALRHDIRLKLDYRLQCLQRARGPRPVEFGQTSGQYIRANGNFNRLLRPTE